jgi:hypothetical protein
MPSKRAKRLLRWAGSALSILAIVFIVDRLRDYGSDIDYSLFASLFVPLIALSVVYGATNLLLLYSWKDLLRHFGVVIDFRLALRLYGESQLAKYIPGNIFHFVGRQVLGQEAGLAAWPLGKSVIWEIGALIAAGCLFSILVTPYFHPQIPVIFAFLFFVAVVSAVMWISNRWFSRWVAQAIGRDVVFLAMSALIFLAVLKLVVPAGSIQGPQAVVVCGAYVVAWLIGLLTPGAPAGVGVREVVLYALLHPVVKETELLTVIIFGRIVTVSGDVLFYLMAVLAKARTPDSA